MSYVSVGGKTPVSSSTSITKESSYLHDRLRIGPSTPATKTASTSTTKKKTTDPLDRFRVVGPGRRKSTDDVADDEGGGEGEPSSGGIRSALPWLAGLAALGVTVVVVRRS